MLRATEQLSELSHPFDTEKKRKKLPKDIYNLLLILFICYYMFIGQTFNTLPFLFLNPRFQCGAQFKQCNQHQFCQLPDDSLFRIQKIYGAQSMTTEYDLYCEKKADIAGLQTFNLAGHLLGCVLTSFLGSRIKPQKFLKFLGILNILIGILLTFSWVKSWIFFSGVYFLWALLLEFINSTVYAAASFSFPQNDLPTILPILNCSFPIYGILNPLMFWIAGTWRKFLIIFLAFPIFISGLGMYKIHDRIQQISNEPTQLTRQLKTEQSHFTNQSHKAEINLTFIEIIGSKYRKKFFFLVLISFYPFLNGFLFLLAVNRLEGNFTLNYLTYSLMELAGGLIAILINSRYTNYYIIIFVLFSFSGVLFCTKQLFNQTIGLIILFLGKLAADILWGIIPNYTNEILPKKCLMSFYSIKYAFMLACGLLLPFVNYLAWLWGFSVFLFAGLIQITGFYFLYVIQHDKRKEQQENKLKAKIIVKQ